jgi:SAM-dependent methyltransferase
MPTGAAAEIVMVSPLKAERLNIGAGKSYIPGFANIDLDARADIHLDLSVDRLPFEDDSVSLIFSYHTLEHVPDHLFALSEMHRVLQHDGLLILGLPYVTLTEYNLVNPYHLHNFNEYSFDFFDPERLKGSAVEQNDIAFRKAWVRYYYMNRVTRRLLPEPIRRWQRRHLLNVVRKFDIGVVAIKDPTQPVKIGPARRAEIEAACDECLRSRLRYKNS